MTSEQTEPNRETLDVDVLFVGGGPASLTSAIHLAKLARSANKEDLMIAVVEKAPEIGAHQISGAVLNPRVLKQVFTDEELKDCPLQTPVSAEAVYFLTKNSAFKAPIIPPILNNHGNEVICLSKFTKWLGEQAMALGVNVFTGFAAVETLYEGNRVLGVRTGDKGLDAKGHAKSNFEPGVLIKAKCTVFGEGARGFLTKQVIPRLGLDKGKHPATYETAVKEVWQCPKGRIKPGMVIHTAGYPLRNDTVGGSFVYGLSDDQLVIGLVVSLNYEDPLLEPYQELQKLKAHPLIHKMIEGGTSVAYGARVISSGGYYAMPELVFDGGMLIGESGMILDIARLKGIHMGMESGKIAADVIFENLQKQSTFTKQDLAPYSQRFLASPSGKELYRARNHHQALSKGMPLALIHLGAQELTGGRGLCDPMPTKLDRKHYETLEDYGYASNQREHFEYVKTDVSVDKLTSVFHSGTVHDETQPCHLKIHDFNRCYSKCEQTFGAPCTRFCPANVYDMQRTDEKLHLQLNFTNCVHCQTCDIKCPEDNILWTPPEGGGGPRYEIV